MRDRIEQSFEDYMNSPVSNKSTTVRAEKWLESLAYTEAYAKGNYSDMLQDWVSRLERLVATSAVTEKALRGASQLEGLMNIIGEIIVFEADNNKIQELTKSDYNSYLWEKTEGLIQSLIKKAERIVLGYGRASAIAELIDIVKSLRKQLHFMRQREGAVSALIYVNEHRKATPAEIYTNTPTNYLETLLDGFPEKALLTRTEFKELEGSISSN